MKRKLLFSSNAKRWNLLLRKFNNLYKRIKIGKHTQQQFQRLVNKLQSIYQRLEKMQYATGIKIAGTAIALMMLSATGFAQDLSFSGYLTAENNEGFGQYINPTFGDINGDSKLDLIVGEYQGNIKVFTNDGSGNFTSDGNLQADGSDIDDGYFSAPEFADIEGDNDIDLFVGAGDGTIKVFTNDASGNFTADGNLQADGSDINVGYNSFPAFEDIDGDSDLDLYVVGGSENVIKVFTNDGSGNFTANGNLQADGSDITVWFGSTLEFANIDGDSDHDLYIGGGSIRVFANDGTGNFTSIGNLQADGSDINESYSSPAFADIDDDSDLDLYIGEKYGTIKVFLNDGNGNFTANGNLQTDGSDIHVAFQSTPEFADVDSDSNFDLYVAEMYGGNIKVFTNDGNGNFIGNGNLQADGFDIEEYYASPVFANIDEDSDLDLHIGNYYGNIKVFTNNGTGVFTDNGNLQADGSDINVEYSCSPVFANIDGDGDLDLYVGEQSGSIKVFTNDGSGNFSADGNLQADGIDILVEYGSPVFANIDGDSDLDLYVGDYYGNIKVFTNDGTGNFTSTGNLQADGSDIQVEPFNSPDFADIDKDGDLDLYVGDGFGKISVFINNDNTKINEELNSPKFLVFPNPSSGIFDIVVPTSYEPGNIIITDISGKTIQQLKVNITSNNNGGNNQFRIDLSTQPNGIYFIQFANNKNYETIKVLKE